MESRCCWLCTVCTTARFKYSMPIGPFWVSESLWLLLFYVATAHIHVAASEPTSSTTQASTAPESHKQQVHNHPVCTQIISSVLLMWVFKIMFSFSLLSSLPLCFSSSKGWVLFWSTGFIHTSKGNLRRQSPHRQKTKALFTRRKLAEGEAAEFCKAHPLPATLEVHQTSLLAQYSQTLLFQSLLTECVICITVTLKSPSPDRCPGRRHLPHRIAKLSCLLPDEKQPSAGQRGPCGLI